MRSADRRAQTYPALFNLFRLELLPKGTHIVGYARTKMDKPEFHEKISAHFKDADSGEGAKAKKAFLDICTYQPGAYDKDEAFQELNSAMEKIEKEGGFPADFISEGIDQTRGWFYTLLVLATHLFDKAPMKNVICTGLVMAAFVPIPTL